MLGNNLNEESLFLCPQYENITATEYQQVLSANFGDLSEYVLQLYPVNSYPYPVNALVDLYTDLIWKCPTKLVCI
jgi:hypothetical protein